MTDQAIKPSEKQIENCERWGWEYQGDGLFMNQKGWIGYFTRDRGFRKI